MSVINFPCESCENYTATAGVMLWDNSGMSLCENCVTDKEEWIIDIWEL